MVRSSLVFAVLDRQIQVCIANMFLNVLLQDRNSTNVKISLTYKVGWDGLCFCLIKQQPPQPQPQPQQQPQKLQPRQHQQRPQPQQQPQQRQQNQQRHQQNSS